MSKSRIILSFFSLLLTLSVYSTESRAQVELVTNGSFETGDFTGWTTTTLLSNGIWFVYSGTTSPQNGFTILPPPSGDFAALTDQVGVDSNLLYQDIEVPADAEVTCSAIVYVENRAQEYIIGDGLSVTSPNQQMRVDIMDPTADPYDTGAGVLENLFQTLPGDPNSIGYTTLDFDLTPYAGTTVRFRAAVVITPNVLNGSVDGVTCLALLSENIPTLSEWGMIAAAAGLGLVGVWFAVRRKKGSCLNSVG